VKAHRNWRYVAALGLCAALAVAQWAGGPAGMRAASAANDLLGASGNSLTVSDFLGASASSPAAVEAPAASARRAARPGPYEAPRESQVGATGNHPGYAVYAWGDQGQTRTALVVLHGMGEDGPHMAAPILPFAQSQGWVVIAPTIPYGDWQDPNEVANEVVKLQPQLADMIGSVSAETGEQIADRVLVWGFSRGAQAALRFTLLYPERVAAVAACSAGTYTLPVDAVQSSTGAMLAAPLPYGVADLPQKIGHGLNTVGLEGVHFLISVGEADNHEEDVPRQWDPYIGKNRVERAKRFEQLLEQEGLQAAITVVPGAGHEVNGAVIERVTTFLGQVAAVGA
jgi:predicted esterase